MTVGSDHYLVNAKILFTCGKNNVNESRETIRLYRRITTITII